MKRKWLICMLTIVLIVGCRTEKQKEDAIDFSRADFPTAYRLEQPEEIGVDSLLDPVTSYLYHNDYLVIGNQSHCDYLIEIYSLKENKIVARLAPRGNGPGEVASCFCYASSSEENLFNFKDMQTGTFYRIRLDSSLINNKLYIQEQFRYDSNTHPNAEIYKMGDKRYVGYNMWYLDDPAYGNAVSPLAFYKTEETEASTAMEDCAYFVAPVNESHLLVDAAAQTIWLADGHKDKIRIYNDSLQVVKILTGPDHMEPVYTQMEGNLPMPFINFPENRYYGAYLGGTLTSGSVYLIYAGINGKPYDPEHLPPVELFKFDKKGNPIARYSLDRYIYAISVDSTEKYLYATARKGAGEPAEFIRYKL